MDAMSEILKITDRLGQWTGRKHSSREEPLLRRLRQRDVLLRLAVVWATTIAVTVLAVWWGPPFPYRAGQIHPYDVKARVEFLVFHEPEPGEAAEDPPDASRPGKERFPRGWVLVPAGQPIQQRHLELLYDEHNAYLAGLGPEHIWTRGWALFLIFSLLTGMVVLYVARFQASLAGNL